MSAMADLNFDLKLLPEGLYSGKRYFIKPYFDFEKVAEELHGHLRALDPRVTIGRYNNDGHQGYLIVTRSLLSHDRLTRVFRQLKPDIAPSANMAQQERLSFNRGRQSSRPAASAQFRHPITSNHASPNIYMPFQHTSSTNASPNVFGNYNTAVHSNHTSPYGHVTTSSNQGSPYADMFTATSTSSPMAHVQNALAQYNMHSNYSSPQIHMPPGEPSSSEGDDHTELSRSPETQAETLSFNQNPDKQDFLAREISSGVNESPSTQRAPVPTVIPQIARFDPNTATVPEYFAGTSYTLVNVYSSLSEDWLLESVQSTPSHDKAKPTPFDVAPDHCPNFVAENSMASIGVENKTQIESGTRVLLKIRIFRTQEKRDWYLDCEISEKLKHGIYVSDWSTKYLFNDDSDHHLLKKVQSPAFWPITLSSWLDKMFEAVPINDDTVRELESTQSQRKAISHGNMVHAVREGRLRVSLSDTIRSWPIVRDNSTKSPKRLNIVTSAFIRSNECPGSRCLIKISSPQVEGEWCLICKIGDSPDSCDLILNDLSTRCLFLIDDHIHPLAEMARGATSWPVSLGNVIESYQKQNR